LKQIEELIENKSKISSPIFNRMIDILSSKYYELIPHNFDSNGRIAISSKSIVRSELNLVNYLSSFSDNVPDNNDQFNDNGLSVNGTLQATRNTNLFVNESRKRNKYLHEKFKQRQQRRNIGFDYY